MKPQAHGSTEQPSMKKALRKYNKTWAAELAKAKKFINRRGDEKMDPNHRKRYYTGYE